MSSDSSSSGSNVISNVNDNSLESYLIGETNKGKDNAESVENSSKTNSCLVLSPVNTIEIADKNEQSSMCCYK